MLKIWTIQDANVIYALENDGAYYSDFDKSYFTNIVENLD